MKSVKNTLPVLSLTKHNYQIGMEIPAANLTVQKQLFCRLENIPHIFSACYGENTDIVL